MNPMGMRWMMDAMQGKPKPTNTMPGMIYMLCGDPQRSNTNPADKTSPAIPIGPHCMIRWPFDAAANGLPTTVRDKGTWDVRGNALLVFAHLWQPRREGPNTTKAIGQSGPCRTLLAEPREAKSSRRTTHPTSRKRS